MIASLILEWNRNKQSKPSSRRRVAAENAPFPAFERAVVFIHIHNVLGEQARLRSAGAGAHFDCAVFVVFSGNDEKGARHYLFDGNEMMFASSSTFSSSCRRWVYSSLSMSRISLSFSSLIRSFTSTMSCDIFWRVTPPSFRYQIFLVALIFVSPLR